MSEKPATLTFITPAKHTPRFPAGVFQQNTIIEFGKTFLGKYGFSESQIDRAVRENLDAKFLILKMQKEVLIDDGHFTRNFKQMTSFLLKEFRNI